MNNNTPAAADAPVPLAGTEHAAEQIATQQQPAKSGVMDTLSGIADIGDFVVLVCEIFG